MEVELKDICEFQEGYVNPPQTKHEYFDGNIKWIRATDINSTYIYDTSRTLTDAGFKSAGKSAKLFEPNSLIISKSGTIGKLGIIKDYMCGNRAVINIKPNLSKVNLMYLYYSIKMKLPYIKELARGSVQKNLYIFMLDKVKIFLPSLEEQQKMINVLEKIDKKIELNNEINNNLHDLAEQQFKEIYSKGILKKLDELLFNISTGSRPKGGAQESGVPSIGAEKIEKFGIYDYSSEKYISEDYYEKLKNGKLNSGDVLLYKDGAYTGKVSMCLNGFPHNKAAVNEHVFILNTENNWAQNYLYFVLYNKDNKEMLHRLASSKAAQPGLNQAELKSIEVNICDKEDILKFENNVKPIMEKIALSSLENKRLAELRDTLLPKLMNGEIDLDNIEI